MSYERRDFSGGAVQATLTAGLASATSTLGETFQIDNATGWPLGGNGRAFAVVVDRGTANEEKVLCSSRSGTSITIQTRNWDRPTGTGTGVGHTPNSSKVELCITAVDVDEANYAVSQTVGQIAAKGDLLTGSAVNTFTKLSIGSDNTALIADSAQTSGQRWGLLGPTNISGVAGITKGGLATATGSNTFSVLPVGSDAQVLMADSVAGTGNKWAFVGTSTISDDAIITAKIANVAVTTGKLADAAVTTAKLADAATTTAKLADAAVTTAKIVDAAVTTAKIVDASVTEAKIAAGAVSLAKIKSESATVYTPTWTVAAGAVPVLGSGTLTGRYIVIGKYVLLSIYLVAAGNTTFGAGTSANYWRFSLPAGIDPLDGVMQAGTVTCYDSSADEHFRAACSIFGDQTRIETNVHGTSPLPWGNNDRMTINIEFEVQ